MRRACRQEAPKRSPRETGVQRNKKSQSGAVRARLAFPFLPDVFEDERARQDSNLQPAD